MQPLIFKEVNAEILKSNIELENDRVVLVPFNHDKNQELKEIIFDDEIWRFMGMFIRTPDDFKKYVLNTLKEKEEGISYPFLIIDKRSGRVAGSTRYGHLNFSSEKCEIGWTWYGKEFHGTGLNKACKHAMLKFGFENIGFRRIQFSADQENIRSQKAIEKLGATKEGVFRNNYVDSLGKSRNDVYYSIIKEEWSSIEKAFF